jgi:hypothetical protein
VKETTPEEAAGVAEQGTVRDAEGRPQLQVNPLDQMCEDITRAWAALFASHKDDPATRDLVALGLQHTGQLVGAIQTLAMLMARQPGPTGEFPDGQLNEDDEGELRIAVRHEPGVVILDFGKPVAWIGLPFDQVPNLRDALMHHAQAAGEEALEIDAMQDEENDG